MADSIPTKHVRALSAYFLGSLTVLMSLSPVIATAFPARKKSGYSLDQLISQAQFNNPAVGVARSKLQDYQALLDRAYLAWLPTIKLEAFVAPLPERKQLRECVDLSITNTQGLNEVFPCPGQDLQADERITIDTDIGLLARGSAKSPCPSTPLEK